MAVQAVRNLLDNNPKARVTVVTRNKFQVFFGHHKRLSFHDIKLKDYHKGLVGLRRLYMELKKENFDYFLDFHDVLRSKIVRSFFSLSKTKVHIIEKDRKTKEAIVNKKLPLTQQTHSIERYLDVVRKTGLKVIPDYQFKLFKNSSTYPYRIGIAPFAAHSSKEWGLANFEKLIALINQEEELEIRLFGGGSKEISKLEELVKKFPNVKSFAGKYSLTEEMTLMSKCKVFIAMDSGNMHMASLVGVPTISLWFSTHPFLGFAPWGNEANIIQPKKVDAPCRPVSVYGKIKTEAQQNCVEQSRLSVTPEMVLEKIKQLL
jgi:ADP-heptose:LPS heptosyltransferase